MVPPVFCALCLLAASTTVGNAAPIPGSAIEADAAPIDGVREVRAVLGRHFKGVVYDTDTREEISGAIIIAQRIVASKWKVIETESVSTEIAATATTASNGHYELGPLPVGKYRIKVARSGYNTYSNAPGNAGILEGNLGDSQLNIFLEPRGSRSVRAVSNSDTGSIVVSTGDAVSGTAPKIHSS